MILDGQPIDIRQASADEVIPLRHAILRAHQPPDFARYDKDKLPTSIHRGAFLPSGQCIACGTLFLEPWEGEQAYRLRGMAVALEYQKRGLGALVLQGLESDAHNRAINLLWCNARTPAVPFYERQGWRTIGDRFEIPGIGPHFNMLKRLPASVR